MMENNVFRFLTCIAGIFLLGVLISILVNNSDKIMNVMDILFSKRLQKY